MLVYYTQAAHPENKLHIYIYDTDESVLSRPAVAPYAPQLKAVANVIKGMVAQAKYFDAEAARGNPSAIAAGHKRPTLIHIRGIEAAITIENNDPENVGDLFMFVSGRYAIEIRIEHYAKLGNDNREVAKLLQPFAEAIALETLTK